MLQNEYFFGYKQSTRKEDDIAIVNAGMRVELDTLATVKDLALAFGGMAATTVMATKTMKQLIGWLAFHSSFYCDTAKTSAAETSSVT